jgi:hypothetical protein
MFGWSEYQEQVADFFRRLGLSAETNVPLIGIRTSHDVDVVVRSKLAGFDVLWLVECKCWKTAIPKEKVLALRSIVDDTGADRGFIMAESGYQSGALEASRLANVTLTSIADLKETLAYEIGMAKLRSLPDRVESCRERYWAISKSDRIDLDLRPDVAAIGYSGYDVIAAVDYTVRQAFYRGFPIKYDRTTAALSVFGGRSGDPVDATEKCAIGEPSALYDVLDAELSELERRLKAAESVLRERSKPSANPP